MRKRTLFHPITALTETPATAASLRFRGKTGAAWRAWRRSFGRQFRAALGRELRPVPLRAECVSRETLPECFREKWVYDVEPGLSTCAWLCRPRMDPGRRRPSVLCEHGSGPGKDPLVGLWRGETCLEYHKRVGVRLAQAGFVALLPDRRGFGDCGGFPNGYPYPNDLQQVDAFYQRTRRTPLLALDIRDALRGVDFLLTLKDVDAARIGCLGVEWGGPVAAGAAALHPSIRAVHLALCVDDALRFVGPSQLPRLAGRAGPVELCGLMCPKPLEIQIVPDDAPVTFASARRAARQVASMYRLAGYPGNFSAQYYDGFYELNFPMALAWFQKRLAVDD